MRLRLHLHLHEGMGARWGLLFTFEMGNKGIDSPTIPKPT